MVRAPWMVAGPLFALLMVSGQSMARPQQPTTTTATSSGTAVQPAGPSFSVGYVPGIGGVPVATDAHNLNNSTGGGNSTAQGKAKPKMPESPFGFTPFIYMPGFTVAVFGAVAFAISAAVTTYQYFSIKAWFFMLPFQAAVAAFVGMTGRLHAVLHPDPHNMTAFIIQMMLSSMQPMLISIATMMTFTRIIWWMTPLECMNHKLLGLPHHWISFIWTGMLASQDIIKAIAGNIGKPKEGERPNPSAATYRIQQIALTLQFFVILGWTIWSTLIMKMAKRWTRLEDVEDAKARTMGWVCVGIGGILTWRTLYLNLENDALYNPSAFISQHEWMYWVSAAIPMLITYTLYNFYHPGSYLPSEYTRFKFDTKKLEKARREEQSRDSSFLQPTETNEPEPKGMESHTKEIFEENSQTTHVSKNEDISKV